MKPFEMGAILFLRSGKGMTLIEEGKAVYQFCKSSSEIEGQLIHIQSVDPPFDYGRMTVIRKMAFLRKNPDFI